MLLQDFISILQTQCHEYLNSIHKNDQNLQAGMVF